MNGKGNTLIHWFPGHMTKSLREIESSLSICDVILYVLDSRAPFSCRNPVFDEMVKDKPKVYVLNKADLVPSVEIAEWKKIFSNEGENVSAVSLDGTSSGSSKQILPIVERLAKAKIERFKSKGINASLRGMVIGVPNSGKSTLINNFARKQKTMTGNKPGVTRGQQWVRVNEYFELLDTPGTLYPKLSCQRTAKNLAFIGSVKDEVVDKEMLSAALIEELFVIALDALESRYGADFIALKDSYCSDTQQEPLAQLLLEKISFNRGFVLKGGVADVEKAAKAVLDDFRKGRLGKVILERAGK